MLYKSIHLNSPDHHHYYFNEGKELLNLSRINIFIGPNNSGKSNFLRSLFANDKTEFKINEINISELHVAINILKNDITSFYNSNKIIKVDGINLEKLYVPKYLSADSNIKDIYNEVARLANIINTPGITTINHANISPLEVSDFIRHQATYCLNRIRNLENVNTSNLNRQHIYIPTLRGLRGIDYDINGTLLNKDNYKTRTHEDYFRKIESVRGKIYTGLSLYEDIKRLLLGSAPDRAKIKAFENFINEHFFDRTKEFTIIPHIDDNAVHIKIGDDEDFPIYKLGDGIQSIIILLYPLFFNKGENINFFFEEPDMFLHPGFQRIFLETLLLDVFKSYQFYLTTHSNHFLDMTLDFEAISIYDFHKTEKKEFIITNLDNADNRALEILGVRNSSVFLSNCTIWVEGITDRIYIRKYLDLFQSNQQDKLFLEDIHFSFVEYSGGNITHWSFLESDDPNHNNINVERLCGKIFLITDQDNAGLNKDGAESKKLKRQKLLREKLKERYYCLKVSEIENLLTESVITKVIQELEKDDSDQFDYSPLVYSEYADKKLGTFIDSNIKGLKRKYASDSGTIKDKVEFSKKSTALISSYDDLSEEAKDLAEKIYSFIKSNN